MGPFIVLASSFISITQHWPFGDFLNCFRKIYINITTLKRIVIKNKLI